MYPAMPYRGPDPDASAFVNCVRSEVDLLAFYGRLGRLRSLNYYTIMMVAIFSVAVAAVYVTPQSNQAVNYISAGAASLILLVTLSIAIRRLHDMDFSGWWSLLILVPGVNALMLLAMLIWPGTDGANKHGAKPIENSAMTIIGSLAIIAAGGGIAYLLTLINLEPVLQSVLAKLSQVTLPVF